MPEDKSKYKYHCQYCGRPAKNPQTLELLERTCPQNAKNIKIETQETDLEPQSSNLTDQIAIVSKTGSKRQCSKKTTTRKQAIGKGVEVSAFIT